MLQVFIYLNVFLAGVAVALAAHFAYMHFSAKKHPERSKQSNEAPTLSKASRDRLLHNAEATFQAILEHAAGELQYDLKDTSDGVSGRLKTLGDEIVDTEMKRYQTSLEELRKATESTIGGAATEVSKHQTELKAIMTKRQQDMEAALVADMTAEKKRLIEQLDHKLAGAMTAFLVETLGHNVDLGAQSTYLTQMLEEHKAELIKELVDEA